MEHFKVIITISSETKKFFLHIKKDDLSIWTFFEKLAKIYPEAEGFRKNDEWLWEIANVGRLYWIDDDNDQIEILNEECFSYYVSEVNPPKKKIYIELKELVEHEGVKCDVCEVSPIMGFRYQTIVLPDDLNFCHKCVAKRKHGVHNVYRHRNPEHSHF